MYEVFSRHYRVDTLFNTTLMLAIFKLREIRLSLRCVALWDSFVGLSFDTVALALGPRPQLFKSYPPDKSQSTV